MMSKNQKIIDCKTNDNPSVITSDTNKELKKQIKDISQQVLKRNYDLYKSLENKWVHLIFNSRNKISTNYTEN